MKKLVLSFILAIVSFVAFADGNTCTVPNSNGTVVYLERTNGKTDDWGDVSVSIRYKDKSDDKALLVNVLVGIYDPMDNNKLVDVQSASVKKLVGGSASFSGLKPNHSYFFKIHSASCE